MSEEQPTHRFVDLSRGRMHCVAAGRGDPVVLLHGWPGYWIDYRRVLPLAAGLGQVIAPDFLGFGASDPPDGDPARVADEEALARDVLELIDSLRLSTVVLVGHDIGSAIAPTIARLAPDRVRGLVLLNPTHPYIGDKRQTPQAQRESWYQHFHLLPLAEQLLDGDPSLLRVYLTHFYDHWAGLVKIRPDDLDAIVATYARPGAFAASIAWYRSRARSRSSTVTPSPLPLPTIALWGDRDPMRPLTHRSGFERAFPHSVSRILPGVGHFVPAEAPEAVVAAIAELRNRDDPGLG
jgi:pimeloyl-ACP methyl ester carboxylesterase